MGKTGQYKIPFNGKHMMEYTEYSVEVVSGHWGSPTEWRDNSVFEATVKLDGFYRGRSAARVKCLNHENGESYSFALGALYEAILAFGVTRGGQIKGKWTFRKQGANYGLYPVVAKEA